jgi:hypothetical protein
MKFYCSQVFDWLLPYLEIGLSMTPRGKTVTRIQEWKLHGRQGKKYRACVYTNNQRAYRIYIHTKYKPKGESKQYPYSKIDILELLAHEMAHMKDMHHTPDHKILEGKILKAFLLRLKGEGYISEEVELAVA